MKLHSGHTFDFDMRVEHTDGTAIVTLQGELDVAGVPRLRSVIEGLLAAGHTDLVLNLAELDFCDSTGLGAFVKLHRLLAAAGGRLDLRAARPAVQRVFEITALDRELHLV